MLKTENITKKEVAYRDGTIAREPTLPYPIVHYPGFYGAFFGFQENKKSEIVFCSCTKRAIRNYVKLRLLKPKEKYTDPTRAFILDSMYFPYKLVENLIKQKVTEDLSIMKNLTFKPKLCHECNKAIPSYNYCVKMYGGIFTQTYGWYVNKEYYKLGIGLELYNSLPKTCPKEITKILIVLKKLSQKQKGFEEEIDKKNQQLHRLIENRVRARFGYKDIGESWVNEALLSKIIKKLYPKMIIITHHKPDFLKGLELDIYIEDLKLGIEYQGAQHFLPIEFFGGEDALEITQRRDKTKKELCKKNKIRLVYFYYDEDLSKNLVKERLKENKIFKVKNL